MIWQSQLLGVYIEIPWIENFNAWIWTEKHLVGESQIAEEGYIYGEIKRKIYEI